jgi:hypothetical protein
MTFDGIRVLYSPSPYCGPSESTSLVRSMAASGSDTSSPVSALYTVTGTDGLSVKLAGPWTGLREVRPGKLDKKLGEIWNSVTMELKR